MNKGQLKELLSSVDTTLLKGLKAEFAATAILVVAGLVFFKFVHLEDKRAVEAGARKNAAIRAEITKAGADIRAAQEIRRSLDDAEANLTLLDARLKGLRERLPSDKRLASILSDLTKSGIEKGLRITAIKPLPAEDKGELLRMPFQINAQGGFFAFGEYIKALEELPRIIIVDNFMLEDADNGGSLSSQVFISAYALNARSLQPSSGGQTR